MKSFFKKLLPLASNILGTRLLNMKTPWGVAIGGIGFALFGIELDGEGTKQVSSILESIGLVNPIINNIITYGLILVGGYFTAAKKKKKDLINK